MDDNEVTGSPVDLAWERAETAQRSYARNVWLVLVTVGTFALVGTLHDEGLSWSPHMLGSGTLLFSCVFYPVYFRLYCWSYRMGR